MFDLTIHHLDFSVEALTPIEMPAYKGSALRGAWKAYLQTAYCAAPLFTRSDPVHQATCPVCYLTEHEHGPESRRPYTLRPPLSTQPRYEPGEHFSFGISLFGNALTLFPYVLLAAREMGENNGIGRKIGPRRQRGRFRLLRVRAYNPLTLTTQEVLPEGSSNVQLPSIPVTAQDVSQAAETMLKQISQNNSRLHLTFHTPLRIVHQGHLLHQFDFVPFFQRLLERLYNLAQHFGAHPQEDTRPQLRETVQRLLPLAQQVSVVKDETHWWDVHGYSSRLKRTQPMGGLIGPVTLTSPHWAPLLPFLLWGQSVHVGKNIVKGSGWFSVAPPIP